MRKLKVIFLSTLLVFVTSISRADEGMWLLSLLDGYTIEDMQSKGFKLSAEDIYSVNQACLKDAVVIFGGGCTGELISPQGLLLTNHHCGYSSIQSHSSVENDYLTDGFWAMNKDEELPNPGLSVQFLQYMKDVGELVLEGTEDLEKLADREAMINSNIEKIEDEASEEGKYRATVRPLFYGNQYYLFVYKRYTDIRLVGAPPSTIGNFGEDTDNWMWPRHTGDFSMFRIYADENNEPADYSEDNVPYIPKKHFELSAKGVEKGDFTMLLGYPGSTEQFLYSGALRTMMEVELPMSVDLRTKRMEIMDKHMKKSDITRIQYASKYRGVTNAWKKWQGAIKGIERLDGIQRKIDYETAFTEWIEGNPAYAAKYGSLLQQFEDIYKEREEYVIVSALVSEAITAIDGVRITMAMNNMFADEATLDKMERRAQGLFKNYNRELDQELFCSMISSYRELAPESFHPDFFQEIEGKYNGDITAFAEKLYEKSYFSTLDGSLEIVNLWHKNKKKAVKKLDKDPYVIIFNSFAELFSKRLYPELGVLNSNLDNLYKLWVQGIFEFEPEVRHYPDANFTMRLTYGEVKGYQPEDAVEYDYFTTLSGVIEKNKEGRPDYVIPEKLEELFLEKDYGNYGVNETMPVCFTASNHTSGGNSGSPVLDAEGRLIGINFDRNWHGTMSDEMYDPDMCRNISVDIRYILFIIDKFANAGYLLDEMVIIN